jgi:hypothetical protein
MYRYDRTTTCDRYGIDLQQAVSENILTGKQTAVRSGPATAIPNLHVWGSLPITMAGNCKYLEYRQEADGKSFDVERAYCTAAGTFVQPMRADICNERYDLRPADDCEFYAAASEGPEGEGESEQ